MKNKDLINELKKFPLDSEVKMEVDIDTTAFGDPDYSITIEERYNISTVDGEILKPMKPGFGWKKKVVQEKLKSPIIVLRGFKDVG